MLEEVKPPVPGSHRFRAGPLHYLLFTPFRYPPLRGGSRFGTRLEASLFYASELLPTSLAEVAYYRLVFLDGTDAAIDFLQTAHTCFDVDLDAERAVDLTEPPFDAFEARISSPTQYADAQQLGREMREAGVEACVFVSARAKDRARNVGLFEPCFATSRPRTLQGWSCYATRKRVEFTRSNTFTPTSHAFLRAHFEVEGVLPTPAL
nr:MULTISPECIES: RES family NAD+ phosphorylase [Myxococcaceae]